MKKLALQAKVAAARVRVGPGGRKANRVVLALKNGSDGAIELAFGQQGEISLAVRVGPAAEDLVGAAQDALDLRLDIPETWQKARPRVLENRVVFLFTLPDAVFQGQEEKTITLSDFDSRTRAGRAAIEIGASIEGWEAYSSGPLEVEKGGGELQILSFQADPPCILTEEDRKKFALTWETAEARQVRLYKDSAPGPLLTLEGAGVKNGEKYEHRGEKPSASTAYRLVAAGLEPSAAEKSETVAVQVWPRGWHSIDLAPYGYPALLCSMNGLSVCGIFIQDGRARLYSSEYPASAWSLESEEIPPGMETSPGVCFQRTLWLAGGSAGDPGGPSSSDVWYWGKENTGERAWKRLPQEEKWPPPRMGHACVVFRDRLWVLGGFGKNGEPLNDVWSFDGKGGVIEHGSAPWPPRCMFAAAVFGDRIWVYGGAAAPFADPLPDLWTSEDGEHWAPYPAAPRDQDQPIGDPIACALAAVGGKLNLMGSFRRGTIVQPMHLVLDEGQRGWGISTLQDPWPQHDLNTFQLLAVEYKGLLFLRTLSHDPQAREARMTMYLPR